MRIIQPGEKIHIIHRTFFEKDVRRHFIGTVEIAVGSMVRVTGYLFAMDHRLLQFQRRDSLRTRILTMDSGTLIMNVLPPEVEIDNITYVYSASSDILITDGSGWHMEITHL